MSAVGRKARLAEHGALKIAVPAGRPVSTYSPNHSTRNCPISSSNLNSTDASFLARHGKLSIVHLPERKIPAVAVHGDTFHTPLARAEEVSASLLTAGADAGLVTEIEDLVASMRAIRTFHEGVLRDNAIARPCTLPEDSEG